MKLTKSQALLDDAGELVNGKWELDGKHQILYRATGSGQKEAQLTGRIIETAPGWIEVRVAQKQSSSQKTAKIYRVKGFWRLDSKNRLQFEIARDKNRTDKLRFKNTWTINENHEVIYTYLEESLKTKRNISRTLTLKGYWDIDQKNRLTYYFQRNDASYLRIRGTFQTQSILAKKGEIRYQFGIELEKKIRTQTLTFFGKWKYSRRVGIYFEIKSQNLVKKVIRFGGELRLNQRDKAKINLTSTAGRKLGVELVLTRDFIETDGEIFIQLFKSQIESGIQGGVQFRW